MTWQIYMAQSLALFLVYILKVMFEFSTSVQEICYDVTAK